MQTYLTAFAWVLALAVLLGFVLLMRYMSYRERLAQIENGTYVPKDSRRGVRGTLRWGLAITLTGIALSIGLYPIGFVIRSSLPLKLGPWMLVGLIPLFLGVSLILSCYLVKEPEEEKLIRSSSEAPEKAD